MNVIGQFLLSVPKLRIQFAGRQSFVQLIFIFDVIEVDDHRVEIVAQRLQVRWK